MAFSGIDGSGKTTQARLLVRHLRGRGVDARYATAVGPNARPLRLLKDRIAPRFLEREAAFVRGDAASAAGGPSADADPADASSADTDTTDSSPTTSGTSSSMVGRALGLGFLARGVWQSWATPRIERDGGVVVLDRYLHDDLVRVAWRYGFDERRLARLSRLVPDPDLHVRLLAASSTAWERESDGRTAPDEHAAKNACYDRLFDALPDESRVVSIDTEASGIEATHRRVREAFEERVAPLAGAP